MSVVIGIDVGGSTTKIVGFDRRDGGNKLIQPLFVRATDPITALYGAFGKFTDQNGIELSDIEIVKVTGVGSAKITKPIYGLRCEHVSEFDCIGLGGLYLSGLEEAIVVSLGTGTALIHARRGEKMEYLGGTGVGGGTLIGLSKRMLGLEDIQHIQELAESGDLDKIDWRIRDISKKDILPGAPDAMTASNFGNISDIASKSDVALGIINMVFETIAMVAMFAARNYDLRDIVLTGNLTTLNKAKGIFGGMNSMFNLNFMIPENSQFGTVIGAALTK
ncbi:MAG: type II pantothenate kinase [Clostridia bacterium]|nr:type II pantothenate kinase [Clostridia bacterium]